MTATTLSLKLIQINWICLFRKVGLNRSLHLINRLNLGFHSHINIDRRT